MTSNLERSAGLYHHAANIIRGIGEKMFAVEISDTVADAWGVTMIAIRYMDHAIDNEHDSKQRNKLGVAAIGFLKNETDSFNWQDNQKLNESVTNLKTALSGFPVENQTAFVGTLDRLRLVVETVKSARGGQEYARLTRLEGQLNSKLLLTLIPGEGRSKTNFKKFARYTKTLGRFSNSVDSMIDFSRDWQNREILLEPNLSNRWELAKPNLKDFFILLIQANPAVALNLFGALIVTYKSYSTKSELSPTFQTSL